MRGEARQQPALFSCVSLKDYDTADFVTTCRGHMVAPHVAAK